MLFVFVVPLLSLIIYRNIKLVKGYFEIFFKKFLRVVLYCVIYYNYSKAEGGESVSASQAKMDYINRYNQENYQKITLQVKPGIRDAWKKAADDRGLSLTAFIVDAVEDYIANNRTK